jgi:hypothetical protein
LPPDPPAPEPDQESRADQGTERFRPGGGTHALVSCLLELAVASLALGVAGELDARNDDVAASLTALAVLWGALALYSLALAALRTWVFEATLDDDAVTLRGALGARRHRYHDLSAVEIRRTHTRLVARDNRAFRVRGVRGRAQGERFRARVLDRAHSAAQIADSVQEPYSQTQADQLDKQLDRDDE